MDTSFNFNALLRNNETKHKSKPSQFVSVANGITKRLETNIKNRKSNRLTVFDRIRNLPSHESPAKPDPNVKVEHRRLQLEKWKEEKEKKKREAAAQKKKPFVTGIAHAPIKFVPPPPPKPSTSGRVTRSQAKARESVYSSTKQRNTKSFAPKNATFKAPEIKNLVKLPVLAPPSKSKAKKTFTFEPVLPSTSGTARQTRSKTTYNRPNLTEVKPTRSKTNTEPRSMPGKVTKSAQNKFGKTETKNKPESSVINTVSKEAIPKKGLTSKQLLLSSTSDESPVDKESPVIKPTKRKSLRKSIISINESVSDTQEQSIEPIETKNKTRKSLKKRQSLKAPISISSSLSNSSVEIVEDNSPVMKKYPVTPKSKVPRSESSSEEKLRSPKTPVESPLTPEQMDLVKKISPCVTLSRGKENARKEMKWKIHEGYLDCDSVEHESVEHFRQQLASEISRMTSMCEIWDKVLEQTVLPEAVQEAVLSAVGQARLLMSQKLQQFASLVERCARPEPAGGGGGAGGAALVTPADLHGFWDMVFMQVENVDMRFKKLEELRARNWAEEVPVDKPVSRPVHKPVARPARRPAASSRIKDMIAAARKAKQQIAPTSDLEAPNEKTFEAGFFTVRSPVKGPTPSKHTLLKAVLSSEAKKSASRNSASFAMLRASILGKNADYDGVALLPGTPMTPINLYATPGRSILKSANNTTNPSGKKSIKLVLFTDNELDSSSTSEEISTARYVTSEETTPPREEVMETQDSGISSTENQPQKSQKQTKKLTRQHALDTSSPVMVTRNRRKSAQKDVENSDKKSKKDKTPKSGRKKKAKEVETNESPTEKTPRKSAKKTLQEIEVNLLGDVPTPRRSLRPRKSAQNV